MADARARAASDRRRAVFLDRDGTVLEDRDYLDDPDDVRLIPGAAAAIRRLRDAGLPVVVVTNQSGIARGLYCERDYHAVQKRVEAVLAEQGAGVSGTYYCPHHPDFTGPCDCRKPGPGMYRRAAEELHLAPESSFFVGDKVSDVLPARLFGGTGVLVRTGYGRESEALRPADVIVVDDLGAAADLILARLAGEEVGKGKSPRGAAVDRPEGAE